MRDEPLPWADHTRLGAARPLRYDRYFGEDEAMFSRDAIIQVSWPGLLRNLRRAEVRARWKRQDRARRMAEHPLHCCCPGHQQDVRIAAMKVRVGYTDWGLGFSWEGEPRVEEDR